MIVATNLTLNELQHPQDTAHTRIYDRLPEMFAPVRFSGVNFRQKAAQAKLDRYYCGWLTGTLWNELLNLCWHIC